ncbi:MAG: hypothetical protein VKI63_02160 [Cyanobium sp.]|jgi:hypothetical protein|nr:hypothetical protein [Cyanobium sp.]
MDALPAKLVPWSVFSVALLLKLWQLMRLLLSSRARQRERQRLERLRAALERSWLQDQPTA